MSTVEVHELHVMHEAGWSFRDPRPTWQHLGYRGSSATFDPCPAYMHECRAVHGAVEAVTGIWPPTYDIDLMVADREEEGRSNGFSNAYEGGHYEGDTWVKEPTRGLIMLSGKRIPPHPAMTRYLVAHEYGHHVEWMINQARGAKNLHDGALIREYAQMRGLPDNTLHAGTPGDWHSSANEIFACDFRILVCGIETEFWPHPGIPRPESIAVTVIDWWNVQREAQVAVA